MIILSDKHYLLSFHSPPLFNASIMAKEALRLLNYNLENKYWCILDHYGKAYLTKRDCHDTIKIRNPVKMGVTDESTFGERDKTLLS